MQSWNSLARDSRARLGIAKDKFARLLGVSISTVCNWEYEKTEPHQLHKEILTKLDERFPHIEKVAVERFPGFTTEKAVSEYFNELIGSTGAAVGLYKFLDLLYRES